MNPYKDSEITEKSKIRVFESNVDSGELHWHRDRETRLVEVIEGEGWLLQLDDELPVKMIKGGKYTIPEGIYQMEYLNPNSKYHLSIKVNYPNAFDREKAKLDGRTDLGGDIMIHGKNVTIGCIPVGDKNIEEIFILATKTKNKHFPIIIAPHDFRTNKTFPEIEAISWENELYENISKELTNFE